MYRENLYDIILALSQKRQPNGALVQLVVRYTGSVEVRSSSLLCSTIRCFGSVGRAHRSHRWGHWFESSKHHQNPRIDRFEDFFFLPRGCGFMKKVVSRKKLGKKARKALDSQRRVRWLFSPTTRKVESKKIYNRNRKPHTWIIITGMGLASFLDLPRDL